MVSIGLVDDHPLMIEGIITLFSRTQGLAISSTGSTAKDIIDISSRFQPDVIIVDLSMAGDVYEAIATSIKVSPNTKIVAFTAATGVDSAIRALDAGANGYVLKGSSAQELIQAIDDFIKHHNANPKAFVWTKKAADILEKVARARAALNNVPTA